MLQTNKDQLVITEVLGEITHPALRSGLAYTTTWEGKSKMGVGMGSIRYNVKIGDPCFGWAEGENVEPGVSIDRIVKNSNESAEVAAFRVLACIGNEAIVFSGEAKGAKGIVTGKSGYVPHGGGFFGGHHVSVSFSDEDLEKLAIGDKVAVKARGVGLTITEFEDVRVFSVDPDLIERIVTIENGKILVPVVKEIPPYLMGQGSGGFPTEASSFEIQTACPVEVETLELTQLRLGDIVACQDTLASWARGYFKGAITIGIVCSGSSELAGHGIGVTCILTTRTGKIVPKLDPDANIGSYLGLLE